MNKDRLNASAGGQENASELITKKIQELDDWRGEVLAEVRRIILEADSGIVEEVKWRKPSNAMLGVPVWSREGMICTGETYKNKVKLTFARGASLEDPAGLFNASLGGKVRHAIDIYEEDKLDEAALTALIQKAVAHNLERQEVS